MRQPPPTPTRPDPLFPYTSLFRSGMGEGCLRPRAPGEESQALTDGRVLSAHSPLEAYVPAWQVAGPCWQTPPSCAPLGSAPGNRCSTSPFARSVEHTSELQSLMRISYAVFCLTINNHNPIEN